MINQQGEHKNFEAAQSARTSNTKSDEKRVYLACKDSLEIKYYSVKTRTFLWIWLIVLTLFIGFQLFITFDSQSKHNQVNLNKEVIVNAETRIDLITKVQRRFRALGLMAEGLVPESKFNLIVANAKQVFLNYAATETGKLEAANIGLFLDSSLLAETQREILFEKSVKVYNDVNDNGAYDMLTTFHATDRLIETSMKAQVISKMNLAQALPIYNLIFKNSLNDILAESQKNTVTVTTLLDVSHENLLRQAKILTSLIAIILCLGLIGHAILLFTLYNKEVSILSSLSKLGNESVQNLAKNMIRFKTNITEELYYEEENIDYLSAYSSQLLRLEILNHSKRKQEKNITKRKIKVKYANYLFKTMILFIYLIIFLVVDVVQLLEITNKLYSQVQKIIFVKQLQEQVSLASVSFTEILATNSTDTIINQPVNDFYQAQMIRLRDYRMQILPNLQNYDNSLDDFIQIALSGNSCTILQGTPAIACVKMSTGSQDVGLLRFLVNLENVISSTISTFWASNRTKQDSANLIFKSGISTVPLNNIITSLIDNIYSYLDEKFDQEVEMYSIKNNSTTFIGIGVLLLLNGLLWIFVMKPVRECDNDMKKVLKNFPVNMVLNNPTLRLFILKTCGNTLDSVKKAL